MRRTICLAVVLLCAGSGLAQPLRRPEAPRFSAVVAAHFDQWDADHNATLSPDEIDRLVVNPAIHGPEAAALAAMKLVVRSTKIKPPQLTRDFLAEHSDEPAGLPVEEPGDSTRAAPGQPAAPFRGRPPPHQRLQARALF